MKTKKFIIWYFLLAVFMLPVGVLAADDGFHMWDHMTPGSHDLSKRGETVLDQVMRHQAYHRSSDFTEAQARELAKLWNDDECDRVSVKLGHLHSSMSVKKAGNAMVQGRTKVIHKTAPWAYECKLETGLTMYVYTGSADHCNNVAIDLPKPEGVKQVTKPEVVMSATTQPEPKKMETVRCRVVKEPDTYEPGTVRVTPGVNVCGTYISGTVITRPGVVHKRSTFICE